MDWKIPLSEIDYGVAEAAAVDAVLKSKWLSQGPVTAAFEKEFAAYLGADQAIAVSSGTAALHLALKALGIAPGDEVIVPSLTFVATANAVLYVGGRPVFADVTGADDLNISASTIEARITGRTRGIIVVHYGGYPAEMEEITALARSRDLFIIEDAAHAPGARYKDKAAGTIGDIGCFSFFANKNLVTGEGGMVVTDDQVLADAVRLTRSHGMTTLTWDRHRGHAQSYDVVDLGFNYRISEIASALGRVQLAKLDANNERRRDLDQLYRDRLAGVPGLSTPFTGYKHRSAYHLFVVLIDDADKRQAAIDALKDAGIQTSCHYPPIHLFTYHRERFGSKVGMLPVTEGIGKRLVTLPLYPGMTVEMVETVAAVLKRSLK